MRPRFTEQSTSVKALRPLIVWTVRSEVIELTEHSLNILQVVGLVRPGVKAASVHYFFGLLLLKSLYSVSEEFLLVISTATVLVGSLSATYKGGISNCEAKWQFSQGKIS